MNSIKKNGKEKEISLLNMIKKATSLYYNAFEMCACVVVLCST